MKFVSLAEDSATSSTQAAQYTYIATDQIVKAQRSKGRFGEDNCELKLFWNEGATLSNKVITGKYTLEVARILGLIVE